MRALALLFSCFTLFGAFAVGNFAQVNSVVLPLAKIGLDPFICSLFIAAFVAAVLLGGIKRVAWIASFVVPFKAALYLGVALLILALNADKIVPALSLMIHSAFDLKAAAGVAVGFSIVKAISSGFDRGLFATDAGTGVVPILQSSAKTSDPVIDGLTTLVAPFLVMIVCTTTGLVLLVTGTFQEAELQSTNMVTAAFERGLGHFMGSYIVIASLLLFAYTTILAWACCAERAAQFLFGEKGALCFKGVYILLIPVGALLHVDLIWRFADISISLMLIANLIGVARLSPRVIAESKRFFSKIPSTD